VGDPVAQPVQPIDLVRYAGSHGFGPQVREGESQCLWPERGLVALADQRQTRSSARQRSSPVSRSCAAAGGGHARSRCPVGPGPRVAGPGRRTTVPVGPAVVPGELIVQCVAQDHLEAGQGFEEGAAERVCGARTGAPRRPDRRRTRARTGQADPATACPGAVPPARSEVRLTPSCGRSPSSV